MRYLGIDYGTRRVGLALSDQGANMGFPHSVLPNDARLTDEVCSLIEKEGVERIVMGDSRDFNGKENPVASEARAFAESLTSATNVPVVFEPEVLTTQEARRGPEGLRTHGVVDASAAALILTSYLSRHGIDR